MNNTYSIVVQPPPFTLKGGRFDETGKIFWGEIEFKTPKGPAHVMVKVTLPEAAKVLWADLAPRMIARAAEKMLAANMAHSAGGFGVSMPSPRKLLKRGGKVLNRAAKSTANRVIAAAPPALRKAVSIPLMKIAKARNATDLVKAVEEASAVLGGTKIPGTSIPLTALHPYGAAAAYGAHLLGEKNTQEVMQEAAEVLDEAIASGAIKKVGKTVVKQRAASTAKDLSLNAKFAAEVGIPTLDVHPDLHDAGRMMVSVLRGVYVNNPDALKKLAKLSVAAKKGDKNARVLWALGSQISDAARKIPSAGYSVGDGYGEGYGRAGYLPPAPPVSLYRLTLS